jgi:hypothetical protein
MTVELFIVPPPYAQWPTAIFYENYDFDNEN